MTKRATAGSAPHTHGPAESAVSGAQDSHRLLLTTAKAAALLKITHCSAVRLCSTGKLDYVRVGKQYRIGEEAVRSCRAGG